MASTVSTGHPLHIRVSVSDCVVQRPTNPSFNQAVPEFMDVLERLEIPMSSQCEPSYKQRFNTPIKTISDIKALWSNDQQKWMTNVVNTSTTYRHILLHSPFKGSLILKQLVLPKLTVYTTVDKKFPPWHLHTIYVKCLRTPILSNATPLLHANYMNHRSSETYSKRAFFWRQAEVSSWNGLEMTIDRIDTYIFSKC